MKNILIGITEVFRFYFFFSENEIRLSFTTGTEGEKQKMIASMSRKQFFSGRRGGGETLLSVIPNRTHAGSIMPLLYDKL